MQLAYLVSLQLPVPKIKKCLNVLHLSKTNVLLVQDEEERVLHTQDGQTDGGYVQGQTDWVYVQKQSEPPKRSNMAT